MGRRRRRRDSLGLPPGLHRKGRNYYFVEWDAVVRKNRWRRLGSSLTEAIESYRTLKEYRHAVSNFNGYSDHLAYILNKARQGAANRKLPFVISIGDLEGVWKRSGGFCEVSGVPLQYSFLNDGKRFHPWSPSIDRIDSKEGYTPGNIRIVCLAANLAMNNWGEEVLVKLARFVRKKRRIK